MREAAAAPALPTRGATLPFEECILSPPDDHHYYITCKETCRPFFSRKNNKREVSRGCEGKKQKKRKRQGLPLLPPTQICDSLSLLSRHAFFALSRLLLLLLQNARCDSVPHDWRGDDLEGDVCCPPVARCSEECVGG